MKKVIVLLLSVFGAAAVALGIWLASKWAPSDINPSIGIAVPTGIPSPRDMSPQIITKSPSVVISSHNQPVTVHKRSPQVVVVKEGPSGRREVIKTIPPGQWQDDTSIPVNPKDRENPPADVIVDPETVEVVIPEEEHSPFGVIAGTIPGTVALDVQVTKTQPLRDLGVDIEVGLDVEFNHMQGGVGISVGGKYFATAGQYLTLDGKTGLYGGLGIRF